LYLSVPLHPKSEEAENRKSRQVIYEDYFGNDVTETAKYPIRTSFAFQIGGGIMVNDFFSVGLHFYGLGASKVKVTYEDDWGSNTYTTTKSYSQSCLMLRLGFHF